MVPTDKQLAGRFTLIIEFEAGDEIDEDDLKDLVESANGAFVVKSADLERFKPTKRSLLR